MSKKITFHTDGTELYLSAISVTAYSDEALTTLAALPYSVSDLTVVYVNDAIENGKVYLSVSTSLGTVVHTEDVVPASHPASGAHVVVNVTSRERVVLDRSLYADRKKARIREILAGLPQQEDAYKLSTETLTITAATGNSTIASGISIWPTPVSATGASAAGRVDTINDPNLRWVGVGNTQPTYGATFPDTSYIQFAFLTGGSSQARRWQHTVRFVYDGQALDLQVKALGTSIYGRVKINGRRVTERRQLLANSTVVGQHYRIKFDFTTAASRVIEIDLQEVWWGAMTIEPTATIRKGPDSKFKVAAFGDSHTAGANGVTSLDTWASRAADLLGADEFQNLAIGGSSFGFLTPGTGVSDFRNRIVDIVAAKPDVLLMYCGYNDVTNVTNDAREVLYQAEYEYVLREIKRQLPETVVVVLGAHSSATPATANLRVERANKRAAVSQGVPFVGVSDTSRVAETAPSWAASTVYPSGALITSGGVVYQCHTAHTSSVAFDATKFRPLSRIWGTGNSGNVGAATGNAGVMTSNDNIHMTQAGHTTYERQVAADVVAALRTIL